MLNTTTGVVYLISANNTNLCKIGYSTNLNSRLKAIRSGRDLPKGFTQVYSEFKLPLNLTVVKTFNSSNLKKDERYLHCLMSEYRAMRHALSEWFVIPLPKLKSLDWFKSYPEIPAKTIKWITKSDALDWLESSGVDINNEEILSMLEECSNNQLLQKALQVIEDDAREISYSYPSEQALFFIYSIAIAPLLVSK